jgi:hypothetical protein
MMHATLDINIPNYASAVVSAEDVVDSISSLSACPKGPGSRRPRAADSC